MAASFMAGGASASTYKKLYDFCAQANCADGSKPGSALLRDANGNLFGTTTQGGDNNQGTIFELINESGSYQYKRLYSFCSASNCADGASPQSALIEDAAGNLYGAAQSGGATNHGVVFRFGKNGKYKVLYSACKRANCSDGAAPLDVTYQGAASGVAYDGTSTLFGVNGAGGINDSGTIFRLVPKGERWSFSVVYAFCRRSHCTTGRLPETGLLADVDGNLYGTTRDYHGTLFKIDASGKASLIYAFCSQTNCRDGMWPTAGVVKDSAGGLHGTTQAGGDSNRGTIFSYSSQGGFSSASFEQYSGTGPIASLTMDASGNLFGTTGFGGPNQGNVFEFFEQENAIADIYDFCGAVACGDFPAAPMTNDSSGKLYGTTQNGGNNDSGVVFEFTP
jgi:uncharacterized repeat protein (TIGR03803 family)